MGTFCHGRNLTGSFYASFPLIFRFNLANPIVTDQGLRICSTGWNRKFSGTLKAVTHDATSFMGLVAEKVLAERLALSHDETRYGYIPGYNNNSCHSCKHSTYRRGKRHCLCQICIASMCMLLNLPQQRQMRTVSRYSFSRYRSLKDTIKKIPSHMYTHSILSTSIFWSRYTIQ